MKATFALLVDNYLHNLMRRLAFELNRDHGVGFFGSQLPPHISLKQPFIINNIDKVESYFDEFARKTAPVDIQILGMYLHPQEHPSGLFYNVVETPRLRGLHEQLNVELTERFGSAKALFDGDEYHFHATVGLGAAARTNSYHAFLAKADVGFSYAFTAKEIVMFYYDDDEYEMGSFITYKVLPLGKR